MIYINNLPGAVYWVEVGRWLIGGAMRSPVMDRVRLVRLMWRHGLRPGSAEAFIFAVGCVVAATLLRYAIGVALVDPSTVIFATYYPAILVTTLLGGAWAGSFALISAGVYAWWAFMPPQYVFVFLSTDQIANLLVYFCSGSLVLAAAESYRRLARLFHENEHRNKLVIDELNHRVKNKLATFQAILSHELRNNRDVWDTITARLAAISKTDDLILQSDGRGADLGDIFKTEFSPYMDTASSRVVCTGAPLMLPPKLAVSLALVLHELVTNAAKYGALSLPSGHIKVSWNADRERVRISWVESGGPIASVPTRQGFGSRLFRVALEPFHGRVEQHFDAGGLNCNIAFVLPQDYVIPTFLDARAQRPSLLADRNNNGSHTASSGGLAPVDHLGDPNVGFRLAADALGLPNLLPESKRHFGWVRSWWP